MKIISGKAKFGPNDYELAQEMFEDGVEIFIDGIGAFGGGRGSVIGFDAEDANNYGDDFDDENDFEDPELADRIVCIDDNIGQSDLNWGEWYSLYEDLWVNATAYKNWARYANLESRDMSMSKENESFSFKKTKMNLNEAKRVLRKNGFIVEAAEISIDDLIAFAKLNCSKAMGADVSVKDRCEWPLVEIDITGDAVFKKYNGTCITGYFKERTGARRGASKYFSIFPEESKLVVGPGTSERVNGKLCRLITNEYTYNSLDDLIKFFNRNNFNTTKLPITFSEAKEILNNNGYRLVEDKEFDIIDELKKYDFIKIREFTSPYNSEYRSYRLQSKSNDKTINNIVSNFSVDNNLDISYYYDDDFDILWYLIKYFPEMKKFVTITSNRKNISKEILFEYLDKIEDLINNNYNDLVKICKECSMDKHADYASSVCSSSLD